MLDHLQTSGRPVPRLLWHAPLRERWFVMVLACLLGLIRVVNEVHKLPQRADFVIGNRLPTGSNLSSAIQPDTGKPGRVRASHILGEAVAHVPYLFWVQAQLVDCESKYRWIRFRNVNLTRNHDSAESALVAEDAQALTLRAGCAVRDNRERQIPAR
jgi:hypothetical protein